MAQRPLWRENLPYIVIALIDVFLIGVGMGVPLLAIVYGFGVGWWLVKHGPRVLPGVAPPSSGPDISRQALRSLLGQAAALAATSLVVLLAVWGPSIPLLVSPDLDVTQGIPLILRTPHASAIAWLVLTILGAPALQFMAVVTAGAITLARQPR